MTLLSNINLIGPCLRDKCFDPVKFVGLAAQGSTGKFQWKLLTTRRTYYLERLRIYDKVCDNLWFALLGKAFRSSVEFTSWSTLRTLGIRRDWRTARNDFLVDRCSPGQQSVITNTISVVNPFGLELSERSSKL